MVLGHVTKKNLLKNLKILKILKSAKIDELMTIKGINEKIAKKIIYLIKNNALFINLNYTDIKNIFWSNYFYSFNKN